jgi:hypothetical protein
MDNRERSIRNPLDKVRAKDTYATPRPPLAPRVQLGGLGTVSRGEGNCGGIQGVIAAIHGEEESCTSLIGAVTIKFGANCFLPFGGAGSRAIWRVPVALCE